MYYCMNLVGVAVLEPSTIGEPVDPFATRRIYWIIIIYEQNEWGALWKKWSITEPSYWE